MRKFVLMMIAACCLVAAKAQEGWSVMPEAGVTVSQRVNGSTWHPAVRAGVAVDYTFKSGWIGIKSGLYYTYRGNSLYPSVLLDMNENCIALGVQRGRITQHFLQVPVVADFSWKVNNRWRMHFEAGMYAAYSVKNNWEWRNDGATHFWAMTPELKEIMEEQYGFQFKGEQSVGTADKSLNDNPYVGHSHFDWGIATGIGLEVDNWQFKAGYELSLGDEGEPYVIQSTPWVGYHNYPSIGANYNTLMLTIGYRFKVGK